MESYFSCSLQLWCYRHPVVEDWSQCDKWWAYTDVIQNLSQLSTTVDDDLRTLCKFGIMMYDRSSTADRFDEAMLGMFDWKVRPFNDSSYSGISCVSQNWNENFGLNEIMYLIICMISETHGCQGMLERSQTLVAASHDHGINKWYEVFISNSIFAHTPSSSGQHFK